MLRAVRSSLPRHHLLVANPTAQSGRSKRWIAEAVEQLELRGHSVELLYTEPEGRTVASLSQRLDAQAPPVDVVIYLGGDGTFAEVASGILQAKTPRPLGMLPSGTANDQGLSFGIRRGEIKRNIDIILAHHLTRLDVGRIHRLQAAGLVVDSSYFFDSCGWGIHPDILSTRNRQRIFVNRVPLLRQLYRDKAIYFTASMAKLIESYFSPVKFRAEIQADGATHSFEGLTDAIISSTPIYAGHWVLDRRAKPDDGLFEFAPIQGRRDWASKALRDLAASPIWQEQLDALGLRHAEGFQASHFEIELYRPEKGEIHAQVDGEEWGVGDRYRVEVLPQCLELITPADFVPPWQLAGETEPG
jgi:diacylglycerol kinase family enzyme